VVRLKRKGLKWVGLGFRTEAVSWQVKIGIKGRREKTYLHLGFFKILTSEDTYYTRQSLEKATGQGENR
jgi:hypothetical protein